MRDANGHFTRGRYGTASQFRAFVGMTDAVDVNPNDYLTHFIETHYHVFEAHILSRLNESPRLCYHAFHQRPWYTGTVVCRQLNKTFRQLVKQPIGKTFSDKNQLFCPECGLRLCEHCQIWCGFCDVRYRLYRSTAASECSPRPPER